MSNNNNNEGEDSYKYEEKMRTMGWLKLSKEDLSKYQKINKELFRKILKFDEDTSPSSFLPSPSSFQTPLLPPSSA